MKHFIIAAILVAMVSHAFAQKQRKWTRLQGPNEGDYSHKLLFGPNNEIISQDLFGYYSTTDDGVTWRYQKIVGAFNNTGLTPTASLVTSASGTYFFYFSPAYNDYNNDQVAGIYKSTDYGVTWRMILKQKGIYQLLYGTNNSVLFLASPQNNNAQLYESIDNGASWTNLFTDYNSSAYSILASTSNGVFLSENGAPVKYSPNTQQVVPFDVGITRNCGVSVGVLRNGSLLTSVCKSIYISDGINAWDSIASTPYTLFNFHAWNGDTVIAYAYTQSASGSYNFLVLSTDQGKTWDSLTDFRNIYYGYAYSTNGENPNKILYEDGRGIYASYDRGASWKQIGLPYANIDKILIKGSRIFVLRPRDGYNYNSYVMFSEDNGRTWESKYTSQYYTINQIGKNLNGDIIGTGFDSSGHECVWEYDTTIRGWKKQSATRLTSFDLVTSDNTTYIYFSFGPSLYRSDDNAFSWINLNSPDDANPITALDASSDGTVYFGTSPIMYRSEDHGATWTKLEPTHDIIELSYIKTFASGSVLLGTQGDGLMLSTNKGDSWTRIDGNNFDTVTCIAINSKGEIAAGTNRGLWTSDASKLQWTKVSLGGDDNLYIGGIDVAANDDFYVGTYGSSAWKGTTNYNAVPFSDNDNSHLRVFPNPASENITITLNIPKDEKYRLELFDVLGRRVETLADKISSGDESFIYRSSVAANGIYTLQVTGARTETQKIIVNH